MEEEVEVEELESVKDGDDAVDSGDGVAEEPNSGGAWVGALLLRMSSDSSGHGLIDSNDSLGVRPFMLSVTFLSFLSFLFLVCLPLLLFAATGCGGGSLSLFLSGFLFCDVGCLMR